VIWPDYSIDAIISAQAPGYASEATAKSSLLVRPESPVYSISGG
jgi:hypothetical protein